MTNHRYECKNQNCTRYNLEISYNLIDSYTCVSCRQPLSYIGTVGTTTSQSVTSGAIGGAIIGGLLGGGSGAIIGALIGSAVGGSVAEKDRKKREMEGLL